MYKYFLEYEKIIDRTYKETFYGYN
jgi:hypothetical protein